MPFLIPIIAAGLGVSTAVASFILSIGVSLVLTAVQLLLVKKPKVPTIPLKDRTLNIREPISPRQIIYGRIRVGGIITLLESSSNNQFLHMIISMTGHAVEEIGDIFFNNELVPLDSNGNATGKYAGFATIIKGLGTVAGDSLFNSTLTADIPTIWTSAHKQQGIGKIYIRLKFNRDLYQSIPIITGVVRGKQTFDPRDSVTRWSPNAALALRDYMTDTDVGFAELAVNINDTDWITEANICEESVALLSQTDTFTVDITTDEITLDTTPLKISALAYGNGVQFTTTGTLPAGLALATTYFWIPLRNGQGKVATTVANAIVGIVIDLTTTGTGVHTLDRQSELRYLCDGLIVTDGTHKEILEIILSSLAGRLVYQGGQWTLYTGAFRTPTISFDESDTIAPIQLTTKVSKRELINRVRGVYADSDNDWKPDDFPAVLNATYLTEDLNDELWLDIELDFTVSSIAAQRIGKIELERSRQQISFSFITGLQGLLVKAGDTINYSNARFGWINKVFEVTKWGGIEMKSVKGVPTPVIKMDLRETAAGVFAFALGEETKVDLAPNTNLPDPNVVGVPSALLLQSGTAQLDTAGDGTVISRILVSWTAPDDFGVDGYEVEFKKNLDAIYNPARIAHDQTQMFIEGVVDDIGYDVRVRAFNVSGAKSAYIQKINHIVIGKSDKPSEPDSFSVVAESDGTRRYSWLHAAPPADVRSGGGYEIRFFLGSTSDYSVMTPLHEFNLINSPYRSNELGAGTYTFAIKSVDSTGNVSINARFANNVVLANPSIGNALVQRNEQVEGWDGFKFDCFVNFENELEAKGLGDWASLPATWSALDNLWKKIVTNRSPIVYTRPVIDLGSEFNITPIVNLSVDGSVGLSMKTGLDADGAPVFATQLVLNGDFPTDLASWVDRDTGTGTSIWVSAIMRLNGGTSGLAIRSQLIASLTIGTAYQVKFDVIGTLASLAIDGDTFQDGAHFSETIFNPGTHTVVFVAVETSATLVFRKGQNENSDIDNVTMGEFVPFDIVLARYIQVQVKVTDVAPIIHSMVVIIDSPARVETFEDVDTSLASSGNFERIATGHFKQRTQGGILKITQAQITAIQGESVAGFTKALIDKRAGFGATLVLNGLFPTDLANWTDADTGTGVSSFAASRMRLNGGASGNAIRHQTISGLTIGQVYQIRVDILTNPVDLTIDGDTFGDGANLALQSLAVGSHIIEFTSAEVAATLVFGNAANNNGDVDNVVMRDGRATAEFKIYNASQVLADAVVDIQLRGARK